MMIRVERVTKGYWWTEADGQDVNDDRQIFTE